MQTNQINTSGAQSSSSSMALAGNVNMSLFTVGELKHGKMK